MEKRYIVYRKETLKGFYESYFQEIQLNELSIGELFQSIVGIYKTLEKAQEAVNQNSLVYSFQEIDWEI